jgi:DNA-binding beta-propeller fold protein YncE
MQHIFKGMWGSQGNGPGQFNYPRGIAVDSDDDIYVADGDNHRIQKFTRYHHNVYFFVCNSNQLNE